MGLPVLLEEICRLILGIYKSLKDMNVEIGAEAALFLEKEYINGIAVAVYICGVHLSIYLFLSFYLSIFLLWGINFFRPL
jgi:hypothetical protein